MLKKLIYPLVGIAFVAIFWSCSKDEPATVNPDDTAQEEVLPVEADTQLNVSYGEHPSQVYDLYLPANRSESSTKVIVLVHGGGWTAGDKTDMDNFVNLLQQQVPEYAIVNINYVLADLETPAFPNQFLDIKSVLNQLTQQASALKIMPQFALLGASAGAHISLMYDYVYDDDDQVKMVANIVGPTDFTDPFYSDDPAFNFFLSQLVDETAYAADADLAELTSPALQVNIKSSPTIMFYGDSDPLVPLSNGLRLETALANQNISHAITVYNGGHGDDWSAADYLNLEVQLLDYLAIYLPISQ